MCWSSQLCLISFSLHQAAAATTRRNYYVCDLDCSNNHGLAIKVVNQGKEDSIERERAIERQERV